MIRLRTRVGKGRVFTLYFMGKWVTLINDGTKSSSMDADNLALAADNHLTASLSLKETMNERRRSTQQLLQREGHSGSNSSRVSGSSIRTDREGIDGGDHGGGSEVVSTNSTAQEGQDSHQLRPEDAELSNE